MWDILRIFKDKKVKMNSKLGLGRLLLELPISWMKTLEGGAVWLAIANKTAGQRHACV